MFFGKKAQLSVLSTSSILLLRAPATVAREVPNRPELPLPRRHAGVRVDVGYSYLDFIEMHEKDKFRLVERTRFSDMVLNLRSLVYSSR